MQKGGGKVVATSKTDSLHLILNVIQDRADLNDNEYVKKIIVSVNLKVFYYKNNESFGIAHATLWQHATLLQQTQHILHMQRSKRVQD